MPLKPFSRGEDPSTKIPPWPTPFIKPLPAFFFSLPDGHPLPHYEGPLDREMGTGNTIDYRVYLEQIRVFQAGGLKIRFAYH